MHNLPEYYNIQDYDRPSVAADIVAFTIRKKPCESYRHLSEAALHVLLVQRTEPPFLHCPALPGGFATRNETIEQTAARKLYEKTGVSHLPLSLLYNASAPGRDPRGWIISCAYWTLVESSRAVLSEPNAGWYQIQLKQDAMHTLKLTAEDDTIYTVKFHLNTHTELYNQAPELEVLNCGGIAFDHAEMMIRALLQLRSSLEKPYAAFRLLPDIFTLTELQQVYEAILGTPLLMANFRRKIVPYVEETGEIETGAGHRPSKLFRAKPQKRY